MHCGQTVGWINMKLGTEVGLGPGHIVLDGDPAHPAQKGHSSPNLWPMSVKTKWLGGSRCHLACRQASVQATLCYIGTQLPPKRPQPPIFGQCLLWRNGCLYHGDLAPHRKGHSSPLFSAHVYCGQTPQGSRMPLGAEVGLGPGDIVHN